MPSKKENKGIIIAPKNGKREGTLILIKKTGYANVWLYDQHIYWDNTMPTPNISSVDFDRVVSSYNAQQQAKRRIVIVRR